MNLKRLAGFVSVAVFFPAALVAQTAADSAAIRETALDYMEGWYESNAERMERAVHPELAKRLVRYATGELVQTTAEPLVEATGRREPDPPDRRRAEVRILDIFEHAASVRVTANDWIDYMHMAKVNGEWRIINVLWELSPEGRERMERLRRERSRGAPPGEEPTTEKHRRE